MIQIRSRIFSIKSNTFFLKFKLIGKSNATKLKIAFGFLPKNPHNHLSNSLNLINSSLLSIHNVTGNFKSIQFGKKFKIRSLNENGPFQKQTINLQQYRSPRKRTHYLHSRNGHWF
ncbi:hypothetical protein RF11_11331 [Thelohanellus kitauei]|uniref:Uncharacterized protein n=1 Tax=Thelohanellus kitauei TaxID=669202 RepID=A0A0C2MHQ9_THEKT|nr:hypothetical protein RF11_11331 [Thelohanellus kitauei]